MANAVMTCMRDEGMFVLEWVAYHRVIGFDRVFVATNACTDGTDAIMDVLDDMGLAHHVPNDDRNGLPPQPSGVRKVLNHPAVADCRWLLHIDADEFLNILYGDGHLDDWLPTVAPFDAVAVSWRTFGDSGLDEWPGGLQIEHFTHANTRLKGYTGHNKTMFRPDAFGGGIDHMPKHPKRPGLTLGSAFGREVHPGALYDPDATDHREFGGNRQRHFRWEGAVINHYAIRSTDCFAVKTARGSGIKKNVGGRYNVGSRWYRFANINEAEERTIQRHIPATRALIDSWLEERPELCALQDQAIATFKDRRADIWAAQEADAPLRVIAAQ